MEQGLKSIIKHYLITIPKTFRIPPVPCSNCWYVYIKKNVLIKFIKVTFCPLPSRGMCGYNFISFILMYAYTLQLYFSKSKISILGWHNYGNPTSFSGRLYFSVCEENVFRAHYYIFLQFSSTVSSVWV